MATNKNITMRQYNGIDYDTLYPKTTASQVEGLDGIYTQQQIISDDTKAMYGLATTAVPNDAFAFLGKYAQYWWARRVNKTTKTTSSNYSYYIVDEDKDPDKMVAVYYASSYTENSGKFVLTSPNSTTISYNAASTASQLKGKYCITGASSGSQMYQVPSSASVQTEEQGETVVRYSVWFNGCTYYYISQQLGDWEYLQSSNRNAYPDSGISGDYEYKYLGIPLENAALINLN